MRGYRRTELQRRPQKRFREGLSVRRIVPPSPRGIVKQQRLVPSARVFLFRRKDFPVARCLPVQIFPFLQHHAELVAMLRVGRGIEVVASILLTQQRERRDSSIIL